MAKLGGPRAVARPVKAKPRAVGTRIRRLRIESGLSQRALGEPGSSYAYLSRIEANTRNPSLEAIITIAARLKTTGLYLLTGNEHARCPLCQRSGNPQEGNG